MTLDSAKQGQQGAPGSSGEKRWWTKPKGAEILRDRTGFHFKRIHSLGSNRIHFSGRNVGTCHVREECVVFGTMPGKG